LPVTFIGAATHENESRRACALFQNSEIEITGLARAHQKDHTPVRWNFSEDTRKHAAEQSIAEEERNGEAILRVCWNGK
jgi:hypothetical protein